MYTYFNDLEELEDILDQIIPEENFIFDEEVSLDLIETILHLMDHYVEQHPSAISEPDFNEEIIENIKELLYEQFDGHICIDDEDDEDLNEIIHHAFDLFMNTFYNERSILNNDKVDFNEEPELNKINKQLEYLKSKPQPAQRTASWYEFRRNLLTASNAYKAFESQSSINQLIYEKCQPIAIQNDEKSSMVNINTPFHWGQKYEPLSVSIYEHLYKTKVDDFGCIQHDVYKFLGASPDGINVDPNSPRYGRMLEIKNIVNREITGIPKKEYWIQMQLQMEVCNLDLCDFLETKFTEYENYNAYMSDSSTESMTGIIMYFHTTDGRPYYVYKSIEMKDEEEIEKWEEENMEKYQSIDFKMIWIKNIYWKLEKLSCVLVERNQKWFQDNIGQLEKVWKTIEQERITGFEHRAPNKKVKKVKETDIPEQYFINIDKTTGKTTLENKHTIQHFFLKAEAQSLNSNIDKKSTEESNTNETKIIKIRTESIDETKEKLN
jgi:putative phage-type endonuclease